MFESILLAKTASEIVKGVYYAIRLMKHRSNKINIKTGYKVNGLDTEPSLEDEMLALEIIDEIEKSEEADIGDIEESKLNIYVNTLSDIVQDKTKKKFNYDNVRGLRLLEKLRQDS